ncbi:unnamed protein product [Blepharisma stoltei]|uniref:Dickkopf N-terminal cysteine-rich domain-containing protein n=1 Tax=Blepharisma stoltei TaxID=1481888 RepID=A0AAU9K0G5_9CILI|nr:unnamed protein product [Blepharisma stoltei]
MAKLSVFLLLFSIGFCCDQPEFSSFFDAEIVCPSYACKLATQEFSQGTCIYYDNTANGTYYVTNCTNTATPYCPESVGQNSTCAIKPDPASNSKWPGEKCVSDDDCGTYASQGCVDEVCKGSAEGGSCTTHDMCDPGLYCANSTCNLQIGIGNKGCTADEECVNNAGCDIAENADEGTCVKYLSVAEYRRVQTCDVQKHVNRFCESNLCTTECEYSYCLPSLASENKTPNTCKTTGDCSSEQDQQFSLVLFSSCNCGYNSKGNAYCGLFPGDKEYSEYLDSLSSYVDSDSILDCNTLRRFSTVCMKDWWGAKNTAIYSYYLTVVGSYSDIQENDDCVANVFNSKYVSISQEFDYYSNSFGSVMTILAGAIYISMIV